MNFGLTGLAYLSGSVLFRSKNLRKEGELMMHYKEEMFFHKIFILAKSGFT